MEMNFCRRCGSKLTPRDNVMFTCEQGHEIFSNPGPTASVVLLEGGNILFSKRAIEPNKGMYDFFGGFTQSGEGSEQAAEREITEETGLTPDQYETPQYLGSYPATYRYDGEDHPIVSVYFYAQLKPGAVVRPADDSEAVLSVPIHKVDWSMISGEDTKEALQDIQKLFA